MKDTMRFEFDDALLTYLFGTEYRGGTMKRLAAVCTLLPDEKLRERAFILKERIAKTSDYSWTALYQMTRWNMKSILDDDRLGWDVELEGYANTDDDDEDDEDEDGSPDDEAGAVKRNRAPYEVR